MANDMTPIAPLVARIVQLEQQIEEHADLLKEVSPSILGLSRQLSELDQRLRAVESAIAALQVSPKGNGPVTTPPVVVPPASTPPVTAPPMATPPVTTPPVATPLVDPPKADPPKPAKKEK